MRRVRSLALAPAWVSLLVTGLLVAGGGPATAKPYPSQAKVTDKAGDVPAGIDLVSGRYLLTVGSAKRATWSVRLSKLTDTTFLAFEIHPEAEGWDRIAVFRENGKTVTKMYFIDNGEESPVPTPEPRACPGIKTTWSPGRGEVTVTAPWSCFQAASSSYAPFEFQAYSRVGGQPGSAHDSLPPKDLGF